MSELEPLERVIRDMSERQLVMVELLGEMKVSLQACQSSLVALERRFDDRLEDIAARVVELERAPTVPCGPMNGDTHG